MPKYKMASKLLLWCFLLQIHPIFAKVPINQFYPFGASVENKALARMDDGSSGSVELISPRFPFFNDTYNTLWVNVNGAISFRKGEIILLFI